MRNTTLDGSACFGSSVAISGDVIVVGVPGDNDDDSYFSGSAYVYRWNGSSYDEYKLALPDGDTYDNFGHCVSVSGDNIAIGVWQDDEGGSNRGSVYVYRWNSSSYDEYKLTASDGENNNWFGYSVAISGDYVAVGVPYDDDYGDKSGSVYIYHWNGSSYDEYAKVNIAGEEYNWYFGRTVSISGNNLIVGNNESAVFVLDIRMLATSTFKNDFDGNGKSDILFSNGVSIGYCGEGESSNWNSLGDYSAGWEIVGTGDFDGDDKSDILFSNGSSTGYYSGGQSSDWTPVGDVCTGWEVAGCADFDGSSQDDILFSNGTSIGYYADGSSAHWTPVGDVCTGWEVVGCADFDGNSQDDILFSNGTSIGYYAGGSSADWTPVGDVCSGWQVVGCGDFDGNGKDDILFSNGASIGYYADGSSTGWTPVGDVCAGWEVAECADFDGNGKDDILFSNGASIGCYADAKSSEWRPLGTYASGWTIASV